MSIINIKSFCLKGLLSLSILAVSASHAAAQDNGKTRIKREVQPITYWVESSSLRLRDNPVAGAVVGSLEYGQKVLAYSQYENWVRVSRPGQDEHWVNSDFLSNSRLSWASYNKRASIRSSDVVSVRIKDPDDGENKLFGVRVKSSETGNVLITTRHDKGQGVYFQNRFVSCNNNQALGVRLVGQGSSFLKAQHDIRNYGVDINSAEKIKDPARSAAESEISEFACKVQDF